MIAAVVAFLAVQGIQSTTLHCEYKMHSTVWGTRYTCAPNNFRTSLNDRNVTSVQGVHNFGKENSDVKKLFVQKQSCLYLPLNLGSNFPNLEIFYMMNSNVQHLLNGDLDGLSNLKVFDASHNPITQLGRDFFKGHSTIEIVSFYDCHLKIIDPEALNPLINLKEAHFQYNVCLAISADEVSQIDEIKEEIRDKCQTKYYDVKIINEIDDVQAMKAHAVEESSFTRRNANLIISFLGILSIVLIAVIVRIARTSFGSNWSELRQALI